MRVPIQNLKRFSHKATFSHRKTFGTALAPLAPLATLGRQIRYIRDQQNSNYCTAAARSAAGSYLWGLDMSFEYQTAKEGQVAGAPIFQGADPAAADRASEEYGFLLELNCPLKFETNGWLQCADWTNYPAGLDQQASAYTGFAPYNVYPDYDSIKEALLTGNDDGGVVIVNGFWYDNWQSGMSILPMPITKVTRHSYLIVDWKSIDGTEYLVAQLSQGTSWGDGGLLYMSKPVVNAAFAYPAFNGIGCTIYRKGHGNDIQTEITLFQQVISLCGEILAMLRLRM